MELDAYIEVEETLAGLLVAEWQKRAPVYVERIMKAVEKGDLDAARESLDLIDLEPAFKKKKKQVEFYGHKAFLFGIAQLNPDLESASSVRADVFPQAVKNSVELMGYTFIALAGTLRKFALAEIEKYEDALSKYETAQKAETKDWTKKRSLKDEAELQRILWQFQDNIEDVFDKDSTGLINLTASMHTSRLASYGYCNEAMLVGITHYRYKATKDSRTSDICNYLHNKVFPVEPAYAQLDSILRLNDADALKAAAPFAPTSKSGMEEVKTMTDEQLMDKGYAYPPNHPKCRSILEYIEGSIQVAGLEIPTSNKSLKEILTPTEINALLLNTGVTQATVDLAKATLKAGGSALAAMEAAGISAATLSLVNALWHWEDY